MNFQKNINLAPIIQNDNNSVIRAVRRVGPLVSAGAQKGFTLIELLVVISIIGLLASVVLVALNGARQKSRDSKRLADVNQMSKALELFFDDKKSYPTAGGAAVVLDSVAYLTPTYVSKLPIAPIPADTSACQSANLYCSGMNGNSYCYQGSANFYTITFCLGGTVPGGVTAGVHVMTPGGIK